MSPEHPGPSPEAQQPETAFGFTDEEQLYDRVSDARFRAFLNDAHTTIHKVHEDANSYGEFAFVTLSRPSAHGREVVTFFGCGFHEYRERWLVDTWCWYRAYPFPETLQATLTLAEAQAQLEARLEQIRPYVARDTPSARARLFAFLADLTDEDGALAELEDLGDLADRLVDGE